MLDYSTCRICAEIVATFLVIDRPNWPGTKTSTTIRADIVQNVLNAVAAKGAFKRANHRVSGVWWKWRVAVLASRSQFEHNSSLMFYVEGHLPLQTQRPRQ